MGESYVVVFPTVFARNKIPQLVSNIKRILRIKNQQFRSVKRDCDIILVNADDPVFASSAINLLFGIQRVAIARCVGNNFGEIVSEIVSTGGNLLLKGERFLVTVRGTSKGFLPKDVEIAATSGIIEKKSKLGARSGTENDHDKVLYTHLTKDNAYVCIYLDEGNGGVPYRSQSKRTTCAVYDEISAVSCYETVKQGYHIRIIVCYRKKSELLDLAKMINQIIPRLVQDKIELEFFHIRIGSSIRDYLAYTSSILEIMLEYPDSYVSLALSPLVFPAEFVAGMMRRIFERRKIPILPLAGVDQNMFVDAKEIGLERGIKRLERLTSARYAEIPSPAKRVKEVLKTRKKITIQLGPNNVHDILDSLDH